MRFSSSIVGLATVLILLASPAMAKDMEPLTRDYQALSDSELDARTAFIIDRLDAGKKWAWRWQWGWTTAYASGIAIGTGRAAATNDGENRANYLTTAVKGVIGTTRLLLSPHPGRNGAETIRTMPISTRADKIRRLQASEALLQRVAKKAKERTNWKAHAGNLALNLAGAGATWGLGHADDAYENLALGFAVGEAHIWSAPKRSLKDMEDYQVRFGMKTGSRFDWKVVPAVGGAALQVTW